MTKKIAVILVPLTAVIVFVALCTAQVISFKPNNVSNEAWSYSKSAYQLASDAIAGKTDYPTASDRMKDMAESINTSSGGLGRERSERASTNLHRGRCDRPLNSRQQREERALNHDSRRRKKHEGARKGNRVLVFSYTTTVSPQARYPSRSPMIPRR